MEESKLVNILSTYSEEELKACIKHAGLQTSKNNKAFSLLQLIAKAYPDFDQGKISKEKVYTKFFNGAFVDKRLNDIMTLATKLVEDFIVYKHIFESPLLYDQILIQEFQARKLFKPLRQKLKATLSKAANNNFQNHDHYYTQYQIQKEQHRLIRQQGKKERSESLQLMLNNLDLFYITSKLKYSCEILAYQQVITTQYDLFMLDHLQQFLQEDGKMYQDIPAVKVYSSIWDLYQHNNQQVLFDQLKEYVERKESVFPEDELKEIYEHLVNYSVRQINAGITAFQDRLFQLYSHLNKKDLLYEQGVLSPWKYINMVALGIRLKEFDWTKTFIENQKEYIDDSHKENAYVYSMANYLHSIQEYDQALRLIHNVELSDHFYNIGIRSIQLRIYYETDEFDGFTYLVQSFERYLKRHEIINDAHREGCLNLIRFTKQLFALKQMKAMYKRSMDHQKLEKIAKSIEEEQNVVNMVWVKEKLKELN